MTTNELQKISELQAKATLTNAQKSQLEALLAKQASESTEIDENSLEIDVTDKEGVSALRKALKQSAKKIANSAQEFNSIPKSGTIKKVGTKKFDIPNVGIKYSLGVYTDNDEFISESALTAQYLLKELSEIKSGDYAKSFTLKSDRYTRLDGKSADEKLVKLIGKSFTAIEKLDCLVWKGEVLKEYGTNCVVTVNNSTNLDKLLKNTESKKLYEFDFE